MQFDKLMHSHVLAEALVGMSGMFFAVAAIVSAIVLRRGSRRAAAYLLFAWGLLGCFNFCLVEPELVWPPLFAIGVWATIRAYRAAGWAACHAG